MSRSTYSIETRIIHEGEPYPKYFGSVRTPIFQSATYEFGGPHAADEIRYIRLNNTPNHQVLHKKLALLEGAEEALVTSSGMAAISTALLTVLNAGDHLLIQDHLYGGTHSFVVNDLPKYGITHDFIDAGNPASWASKLRPETRSIYVESISNPLLKIGDLEAVIGFARAHNLVSMIDNTFATPVNYRPPEQGFDVSLHSCTKYLNGHSDLVAGAVIGRRDLLDPIARKLKNLGGTLDPNACFLLERGMKTLALRMHRHNSNGHLIAGFLESHPAVETVYYPGLESSPYYHRAVTYFNGCSGMVSFEPKGGIEAAERFLQKVRIPVIAPSLGGVETLISRPAVTSHSWLTAETRGELGIRDHLIRLSVGIEAAEDLMDDFDRALSS